MSEKKEKKEKKSVLDDYFYAISIENTTDEIIDSVDIFNYEHEKQDKLIYKDLQGLTYNQFLRLVQFTPKTVKKIVLQSVSDNQNKVSQLNSCILGVTSLLNGHISIQPFNLKFVKHKKDISPKSEVDNLNLKLDPTLQLRLTSLMPKTTIYITLHPLK